MKYDAIILAGGQSASELKKIAPYDNEALIIIGNSPMICYVYRALRASQNVGRIIISGPVKDLRVILGKEPGLLFVEGGDSAVDSFANAVAALKEQEMSASLLVMPTDIPFITTSAIDDFIIQSERYNADFFYPLTSREVNESKFPGVSRTYVKLREGTFTGGNLFIIRSRVIDKVMNMAAELVKRRKSPLAMARLFGLGLVIQYFFKRLSIPAVEKRFAEVMGITGKAVISGYAEVGVDVDKPSDLQLAQTYLSGSSL
ncbi:MAG: nucleotidyltransferase family protein [Syntrophomonadaceae bacterium]